MRIEWKRVIGVSAVGNLWSTLVGIPIAWLLLFALEMVVGISADALKLDSSWEYVLFPFMIAWIGGENTWLVYLAFVLLAVPFCFTSIWIERRVALRRLPDLPPERVYRWVRDANASSYALLVIIAAVYPLLTASRAA